VLHWIWGYSISRQTLISPLKHPQIGIERKTQQCTFIGLEQSSQITSGNKPTQISMGSTRKICWETTNNININRTIRYIKIQLWILHDFALPPVNIDAAKQQTIMVLAWLDHLMVAFSPRHSTLEKMTRAFSMSSWDS